MADRTVFALRVAVAALTAAVGLGFAAPPDNSLPGSIREEDSQALEDLSLYPDEVRSAVLTVSSHPQTLAEINRVHRRSSDEFAELLRDLPREEQEKLWDLVRYPALVGELVEGGVRSESEAREIAARYPEPIRETAVEVARDHIDRLVRIHALRLEAELEFDSLLEEYPEETQEAFRTLVGRPEVLTILTEHMHMAVLLGGAYVRDPEGVAADLAALGLEVAQRNAEAHQEWEETLENDPEARGELAAAAKEYAADVGDEFGTVTGTQVTVVSAAPWWAVYPYWYGYPGWRVSMAFGVPYFLWYSAPWWWYSGFYYGPAYHPVYWRAPTYHFVRWHAQKYRHHRRYGHLERHFARHHDRERHDRYGRRGWSHRNRMRHVDGGGSDRHGGRDFAKEGSRRGRAGQESVRPDRDRRQRVGPGQDRGRGRGEGAGSREERGQTRPSWQPDNRRRATERREARRVGRENRTTRLANDERGTRDAGRDRSRTGGDSARTRTVAARTRDSNAGQAPRSRPEGWRPTPTGARRQSSERAGETKRSQASSSRSGSKASGTRSSRREPTRARSGSTPRPQQKQGTRSGGKSERSASASRNGSPGTGQKARSSGRGGGKMRDHSGGGSRKSSGGSQGGSGRRG
jgi:hypothetical protein